MANKQDNNITFTNNGKVLSGKINREKKMIIFNENLKLLGDNLIEHLVGEKLDAGYKELCSMEDNGDFFRFSFLNGFTKDELHQINFENNLDSLIDYETVNLTIAPIFGFIECVRKHFNYQKVFISEDNPSIVALL